MSKNTGKEYEKFVHDIYDALLDDEKYTSVELDVWLEGADGLRQIDILLRSKIANINLTTIIECRDYKNKLNINGIDGFHSKLMDVNAGKGVIISRKGFSKKATNKAKRVEITLCLASEINDVLDILDIEVPIRANFIRSTFSLECAVTTTYPNQTVSMHEINQVNPLKQLHKELLNGIIPLPKETSEHDWLPSNLTPPYYVLDKYGTRVNVNNLKMRATHQVQYFFGYLNDLSEIPSIYNFDSGVTSLIINAKDIPKILPKLHQFFDATTIPTNQVLTLNVIETAGVRSLLKP